MNRKLIILIISFLFMYPNVKADNVITLFLRPYPIATEQNFAQETARKLAYPKKLARRRIEGLAGHNQIAGIFASYAGFIESSNYNGQLLFPRKHAQPKINLIITTKITPVMFFAQTVHHLELEEVAPIALYTIERKQDEDTNQFYWDVQQETEIPRDYVIPLESLIILAKPQHIYVPTGITITNDSPNLFLPNIYVKKGINIIANSLYMLNLMHLFRNPDFEYEKEKDGYAVQVS